MTKIKMKLLPIEQTLSSDLMTPVGVFMKLRDAYSEPVLLESNDFGNKEESHSYIGLDVLASFEVKNGVINTFYGNEKVVFPKGIKVADALYEFIQSFDIQGDKAILGLNGLFGHTNFDAIEYFEDLTFPKGKRKLDIVDMKYNVYRFVLSFNHYKDELTVLENVPFGEKTRLDKLMIQLHNPSIPTYDFALSGKETSNITDEEYKNLVRIGKRECQLGNVFQIVLSRQFQQEFKGDDFQVYRKLRSINPSPYLFYFDFGSYKIFGSSPESQMVIKNGKATVNPIAGTFRRTGDLEKDIKLGQKLLKDPKESSEHIMLVDLARNDLSRHTKNVTVKNLKDVHFFSHVIHLVSKVEGDLPYQSGRQAEGTNTIQVFADTFPAGTLSGAPKYSAINLINQHENQNRSFYGGAIGFINFNGDMNQAILIRSFLSTNHKLYYQAGAGIVVNSDEEKELQEVNNKLNALTQALQDVGGHV